MGRAFCERLTNKRRVQSRQASHPRAGSHVAHTFGCPAWRQGQRMFERLQGLDLVQNLRVESALQSSRGRRGPLGVAGIREK